ncbi:MAG: hypothetical protein FWD81_03790 [Methanomassiliicoccaceae archaeon]|nr:hypothetical protein [Methanomassiliicoccaceae archaeon]
MPKINMNGYSFDGPFKLDVHELPSEAGICLVCTESGYGIKVMSIEDATNIREHIAASNRRDCWKRIAEKDVVDIYLTLIAQKEDRVKAVKTLKEGRRYKMACEEF